jgi:cytochrome c5
MRTKTILIMLVLLVTLGMVLTACGSKSTPAATQPAVSQPTTAPAAGSDGQALLNDRCTKCHSLERVTSAHKSADQWSQTVTRMVSKGAILTTAEQQVLVDYLAKTYGP